MNNPFESTITNQPVYQQQSTSSSTQAQQNDQGMAWWFKWLIKIASVICGLIGFICGVVTALSVSLKCIIAGIVLIMSSFIVLAFEVPICCSFVQFVQPLARFSEARPHWQKVVIYMIPPILVVCLCQGVSSIFGSLAIICVAALYFMLTVGKKAPLEQMMTRATDKNGLVQNEQLPK